MTIIKIYKSNFNINAGYKRAVYAVVTGAVLFTSCKVNRPYQRPDLITEKLYRDETAADTLSLATRPWQSMFNDPALKQLIEEGLAQNLSLKNALENIVQAQATLRQNKLALFPSLDVGATLNRNQASRAGQNFPPGINVRTLTNTYRLQMSTAWEADIWGKLSSAKRSALNSYLQSDAVKRAIQTQLISDIANNYYLLLALDKQLEITELTLKKRIENVETMKFLKEGAVVTGAAVVQSEANRYAAEVTIPDLKQDIRQTENALSILLARGPGAIQRNKLSDQQVSAGLSAGIPALLFQNRPDVQAAEFAFKRSLEEVNVARAFFYPALTVTASGGLSSLQLKDFFNSSVFYNFIGGLTQPIFAQGANKARLTRAQSIKVQALNDFQYSLLNAGQEVSNALYAYQAAGEKEQSRTKQIAALQKSVDFTEELLRFSSATNYTDVLTSEQSLLAAQLSGVSDRLQQLQAVVNLYRALGGGWQ